MRRAFHYQSSTLNRQEETERLRSAHPCFGPVPDVLQQRESERARECMGQIFPWQDPRDAAEGRVQPVKERLRARQSISGLHLHNKWSSRGFCSACTRRHARRSFTHQCTPSRGRRGRERRGEQKGEGSLLEWHSLAEPARAPTSLLLDATAAAPPTHPLRQICSGGKRSPMNEKVNQEPEGLPRCLSLMLKLWKIGV